MRARAREAPARSDPCGSPRRPGNAGPDDRGARPTGCLSDGRAPAGSRRRVAPRCRHLWLNVGQDPSSWPGECGGLAEAPGALRFVYEAALLDGTASLRGSARCCSYLEAVIRGDACGRSLRTKRRSVGRLPAFRRSGIAGGMASCCMPIRTPAFRPREERRRNMASHDSWTVRQNRYGTCFE